MDKINPKIIQIEEDWFGCVIGLAILLVIIIITKI